MWSRTGADAGPGGTRARWGGRDSATNAPIAVWSGGGADAISCAVLVKVEAGRKGGSLWLRIVGGRTVLRRKQVGIVSTSRRISVDRMRPIWRRRYLQSGIRRALCIGPAGADLVGGAGARVLNLTTQA